MDRRALSVCFAFAAASCGGGSSATPSAPTPPSASVTISGQTAGLAPNMKVQLAASLKSSEGATSDCTSTAIWSSSNQGLLKPTGAKPGEFLVVDSGDSSATAVCTSNSVAVSGTLAVHVDKPTSWPVTGRIIDGPGGDPISNASVTFGTLPSMTSSASGEYSIVTPDTSLQRLLISAPGFQTRDTFLRGGTLRSEDIDLLGGDLLDLFRRMGRNGAESPQSVAVAPTRRWTQNPNIYIWTTWKDTDGPVNNVDFYIREIRRVIPQLTGGKFVAGLIETGSTERPLTPGWINLVFDHGGNNALLGANPGRVQLGGDNTCNYIAITHEFGHAMGYWHSGRLNTIMGTTPGYCHEADFTPLELKVAKAMYARAAGNREPDRDPDSSSPVSLRSEVPILVRCDNVIK